MLSRSLVTIGFALRAKMQPADCRLRRANGPCSPDLRCAPNLRIRKLLLFRLTTSVFLQRPEILRERGFEKYPLPRSRLRKTELP